MIPVSTFFFGLLTAILVGWVLGYMYGRHDGRLFDSKK